MSDGLFVVLLRSNNQRPATTLLARSLPTHANQLTSETDELFRAAPVPSHGQIFIRSNKFLYCLGNGGEKK